MSRFVLSLVALVILPGCCCCCTPRHACQTGPKPPLNCLGNSYDGAYSPCYRPPGPFWCCLPGPCSTCRDPWVRYYEDSYAHCIKRPVCCVNPGDFSVEGDEDDGYAAVEQERDPSTVVYQTANQN